MEKCIFCGRSSDELELFKRSIDSDYSICESCINEFYDEYEQYLSEIDDNSGIYNDNELLLTPIEIKNKLDEYVVGQDTAKKVLSVAVYNHYKRLKNNDSVKNSDVIIDKSNVLLIGPTGSGKTYLAQTLAKILNVPLAISDATTLTEAGYVGDDVENVLVRLIKNADYDIEKASRGIVYIDEIDKIARKSENKSITRDVSGEGVQQALLKIIEGTVASVPPQGGRKHPNAENIDIDTSQILFILGGAFSGIEPIIKKRLNTTTIGFNTNSKNTELDENEIMRYVTPDDIRKFGIIPELVGRIPVIAALDKLTDDVLVNILEKPKNALIKQYKKLLEMDNKKLVFRKDAVVEIAKLANERNVGARGLRSIIENVMLDIMYDAPNSNKKEIIITKQMVIDKNKNE